MDWALLPCGQWYGMKMGLQRLLFLGSLFAAVGFAASQSIDETNLALVDYSQNRFGHRRLVGKPPVSKFGAKWTRSSLLPNLDFAAARASVEKRFGAKKAGGSAYVEDLKRLFVNNPNDELAFFRWALAAFLQSGEEIKRGDEFWLRGYHFDDAWFMRWYLAASDSTQFYEVARLRLLLEEAYGYQGKLTELGERILLKKPGDRLVMKALARHYALSGNIDGLNRATSLANELLRSEPKRVSYLELKYLIASGRANLTKKREDIEEAIDWSNKILALIPAESSLAIERRRMVKVWSGKLK